MKRFIFEVVLGAAMSLVLFSVLLLCEGCGGPAFTSTDGVPSTASTVGEVAVACVPGERQECPCSNGAKGIQECDSKGAGYGSCACPTPVAVASGDSGSGAEVEAAAKDPNAPPQWLLDCLDDGYKAPTRSDAPIIYDCANGDPQPGTKPFIDPINGKMFLMRHCYQIPTEKCWLTGSISSPYDVQCNIEKDFSGKNWECPK